jgi:hypothetical protein
MRKVESISIQVKDERLKKEIRRYKRLIKDQGTDLWTFEGQTLLDKYKQVYRENKEKGR